MKSLVTLIGKRRRRIVGLMSGTSADGVDAAVMDVERLGSGQGNGLTWELLDFQHTPYDPAVRAEILAVQESGDRVLPRLTRLHFILGHLFADAVERAAAEAGVPLASVDVVACPGQTVCHLPAFGHDRLASGGAVAARRPDRAGSGYVSLSTLQLGAPAVIAERLGVPVLSDFRSRDVAAGGTGAPLVPIVDHLLYADPERSRLALNVGGVANFTAVRAGAAVEDVIAFDTGPGNMVLDGVMTLLTGGAKHVDGGGALARKGSPREDVVGEILRDPFFSQAPPRAAGREQFGLDYARAFLDRCRKAKLSDASTLATATWLTAASVHDAYSRYVAPAFAVDEVIVSGGGAHNVTLLQYLSRVFGRASVVTSDYYGLDPEAKEAAAFALLAELSLEGRPGNLPGVTGAAEPVVLGNLTPGRRPSA